MTDIQNKNYIIALDQGTTSSRAIIFDRDANVVCITHKPVGSNMTRWKSSPPKAR
jgi:glycerol kinase